MVADSFNPKCFQHIQSYCRQALPPAPSALKILRMKYKGSFLRAMEEERALSTGTEWKSCRSNSVFHCYSASERAFKGFSFPFPLALCKNGSTLLSEEFPQLIRSALGALCSSEEPSSKRINTCALGENEASLLHCSVLGLYFPPFLFLLIALSSNSLLCLQLRHNFATSLVPFV